MKKLSVLLLAAAVALGAAAGNKIVNPKTFKNDAKPTREFIMGKNGVSNFDTKQYFMKALDHKQSPKFKADGDVTLWDFEDADQFAQWTIVDNDGDGYNWQYYNNTGLETGRMTAYSGEGLVASASYINDNEGGGTPVTPDNWLISPKVTLTGNVGFYAMGQDASFAAEVFAIYVAVGDGENIEDFVKISNDYTATSAYKLYSCDLSAYEGMEGRIAIRHYNVSDMFMLNIDDVMIGDFEVAPEPETPTVITQIPVGCQVYTYNRNSACLYQTIDWNTWSYVWTGGLTDGKITVAFDDNGKVYIQNPLWQYDSYDTWVEGTYDWMTGIISIPTGQYLSWSDSYGYGIQLFWGYTYTYQEEDEYGEMATYLGYAVDERATEIQFMIDDDCLYLLGSEGDINADFPDNFNAMGMVGKWSDEEDIECVEFCNRDEYGYELPFGKLLNLVPATPADPTIIEWSDCGDESGYSYLYFNLPTTDVDGNAIDQEHLSYRIYLDNDQLFTFDAVTYGYDITTDMTEIPYGIWGSGYDFSGSTVYFYRTNAEGYDPFFTWRIGIQVVYTVNGEAHESNIVYYEVFPQGVTEKTDAPSSSKENYVYNDGNLYYNAYYVTLIETEPSTIYYRIGVMNAEGQFEYGDWMVYEDVISVFEEGTYMIEAYAVAPDKTESDHIFDGFTVSKLVDVEEIMAGKQIANVRYYNVAGQEMAQPAGMTIQVTTYTDGSKSAVKVVK